MDYKKIIRSRPARQKLLRLLSFVPDAPMLKIQYRIKMGRKLNLKNPQRFSEKLQWYKLYYRDPLMVQCADKHEVRLYVESKGLNHILNECYGVYNTPNEINFNLLPNQFVLKDALGGGGNEVIICTDKSKIDWNATCNVMGGWCAHKLTRGGGREWVYYSDKPHRILVERYISSDPAEGGLVDYKFFCFDGKVYYIYVIADRNLGSDAGLGIYTPSFEKTTYERVDEHPLDRTILKPPHFQQMLNYAELLSQKFPHVRVDLYNVEGKIIFGEMTFYDGSGYAKFNPDSFDLTLGNVFALPPKLTL